MCGIAGIVGLPPDVALPRVRAALRLLVHRGPDGEGIFAGDSATLGVRRLAVIDVVNGHQPIYNEDGTIVAVCNGELYNYVEEMAALARRGHVFQSQSDVNVIPHAYEELGSRAVERFGGMFAAAVWDGRQRRAVLWRDRVGKKPIYYAVRNGVMSFASELPALLRLCAGAPVVRYEAVADYLRLAFVPHPATIYEGVFALPPGHLLEFEPGGVAHLRRYWSLERVQPFVGARGEAEARTDELLRTSVRRRLRSDVPVGLFLSAGIDSGLVAAHASEIGRGDLVAFVVDVDDSSLNESAVAVTTAKVLGLPVEVIPLRIVPSELVVRIATMFGQPFGDSSALPTYLVSQAARRSRTVVLNGDGGDEVFAGYRRYILARIVPFLDAAARGSPKLLRWVASRLGRLSGRRSGGGFIARALRGAGATGSARWRCWTSDLLDESGMEILFPSLAGRSTLGPDDTELGTATLREFLRADFTRLLPDALLVKIDIATMANGVEARSPFLDTDLIEFAWGLPDRWLVDGWTTKPLLRSLARRQLSVAVAEAPKRGFEVPVAQWFEHDLRPLVQDTLCADGSRVGKLGSLSAVRRLVGGKLRFEGNHAQLVWALLMLELFLRSMEGQDGGIG